MFWREQSLMATGVGTVGLTQRGKGLAESIFLMGGAALGSKARRGSLAALRIAGMGQPMETFRERSERNSASFAPSARNAPDASQMSRLEQLSESSAPLREIIQCESLEGRARRSLPTYAGYWVGGVASTAR